MADISPLYREKFLYLLVIAAVASILYRRCRSKPGFQFLYNLELLALFISFNRSVVIQADRISWNLEFFHLLLIPALISACKKKWQKGVVGAVCIGVCLWFCWYEIFHCGYHEVVPYRCVFFSEVRFGWCLGSSQFKKDCCCGLFLCISKTSQRRVVHKRLLIHGEASAHAFSFGGMQPRTFGDRPRETL